MPAATPFLRRRVLDGLPVDRLNGLWTRGFNEYYRTYIATSSMRPLIHIIGLYSVTGYTMSHAVKHSQTSNHTLHSPHSTLACHHCVVVACLFVNTGLTFLFPPLSLLRSVSALCLAGYITTREYH